MLLVIGLDGATWDLIDPWIDAGLLPHLKSLKESGLHGSLRATVPPATLPSWTSFTTGCNPGRHGVFDFTRRVFGTYDVQFVNATFRKQPSVWRRLSDAGLRVAVLGVPGTFPPEDLNGCMVSGFDTPVTTRADDSFVSPPELATEVAAAGGFPFADFQEFAVGDRWYHEARERLLAGIEKKTRLACSLLRQAWDCFVLVFGESDTVAHHFWQFHDRSSPRFDAARAEAFGDAVQAVYRRLDQAIGEIMAARAHEAVMVVSDHGFGGAGTRAFHLNRCLSSLGFQQRVDGGGGGLAAQLKRIALTAIPSQWQARAFRLNGGRWASRLESRARFAGITWERTRAFSEELNYFPNVWLNLRGREPHGTVDRIDYERVRNDICAALEAIEDPFAGGRVVRRAWRREELYHGPWVSSAPDVILELVHPDGYSYNCLPSATAVGAGYLREMRAEELAGGKLAGMAGSHRQHGIFIFTGTGKGKVDGARIEDAGATILAYHELAIDDLDGRALGVDQRLTSNGQGESPWLAAEVPYDAAEEAELAQRLGALGYL